MVKRVFRYLSLIFGAAITLNGVCMLIFANTTIGSWLTVLLGLILFIPALCIKLTRKIIHYTIFKLAAAVLTLGISLMLVTAGFLYIYGNNNTVTYNEEYLVILGCGVRGTEPTEPLRARLNAALDYLEINSDCMIITSGGQGRDEDISEAEAMKLYLTEHGIDSSRILTEDRSTSTTENFKFSNSIVDGGLIDRTAAFITNDYHIYRASTLAGLQGYRFNHLGAPTSWYNILPSYLREFLAIIQMFVFNR